MKISAGVDDAVLALIALAKDGGSMTTTAIAETQQIPNNYLQRILAQLRTAGFVAHKRGSGAGFSLARPPASITIADIVRAIDGPLIEVFGRAPEDLDYPEASSALRDVWVATRAAIRSVLEEVTIADVAAGRLPPVVSQLTNPEDAWVRRHWGPWSADSSTTPRTAARRPRSISGPAPANPTV
jgi:Rrf2 family protein